MAMATAMATAATATVTATASTELLAPRSSLQVSLSSSSRRSLCLSSTWSFHQTTTSGTTDGGCFTRQCVFSSLYGYSS